jgi:hypothetical protein
MSAQLPATLHFLWIGPRLPWFARLAIESALRRCPDAQIMLWASHALEQDEQTRALREFSAFQLQPLTERALFAEAPQELPLDLLARLFATLQKPEARTNIARLLVLAQHGGIYLDTDTLTLRDLAALRGLGAFCGLEHVIWPLHLRYGVHSYRVLGGPLRGLVRSACARLPRGEQLFRRLSGWYWKAANNAVLGFTPRHPFLSHLLQRIAALPERERELRYRLGTHLLQEALAQKGDVLGVHQLAPSYFYPLGPAISQQYFRPRKDAPAAAAALISPETYVIHWYASVSKLSAYDRARVQRERDSTIFAQLAERGFADAANADAAPIRRASS